MNLRNTKQIIKLISKAFNKTLPNARSRSISILSLSQPKPQQYTESIELSYSPQQLYNVVANVDEYKEFIPWCVESRVFEDTRKILLDLANLENGVSEEVVLAELGIGFRGIVDRYTSVVTMKKHSLVKAVAHNMSMFKTLVTQWSFSPVVAKPNITHDNNWLEADNTSSLVESSSTTLHKLSFIPINPIMQRHLLATERPYKNYLEQHSILAKPMQKTKVRFDIEFEFNSPMYNSLSQIFFNSACKQMVNAFASRCQKLYLQDPTNL